jgi:hypothetical protein
MELQTKRNFGNSPQLEFCGSSYESAVEGAQAILVTTEWDCFK